MVMERIRRIIANREGLIVCMEDIDVTDGMVKNRGDEKPTNDASLK